MSQWSLWDVTWTLLLKSAWEQTHKQSWPLLLQKSEKASEPDRIFTNPMESYRFTSAWERQTSWKTFLHLEKECKVGQTRRHKSCISKRHTRVYLLSSRSEVPLIIIISASPWMKSVLGSIRAHSGNLCMFWGMKWFVWGVFIISRSFPSSRRELQGPYPPHSSAFS